MADIIPEDQESYYALYLETLKEKEKLESEKIKLQAQVRELSEIAFQKLIRTTPKNTNWIFSRDN